MAIASRDLHHPAWQAACILDTAGCVLNASPSLAAFFACDLRGQSILAHVEPPQAMAMRLRSAAGGRCESLRLRLRQPGGALTWVRVALRPAGAGDVVACFSPP